MDILNRVTTLARAQLPLPAREAVANPDADLQALGLDSLALAEFLMALEGEFGVTFPADRISRETFRSTRTTEAAIRELLATAPRAGGEPGK